MEKKNRNEELQSRREFFKKAVKTAMPILGAVVLVNTPVIAKAEQSMGCNDVTLTTNARTCKDVGSQWRTEQGSYQPALSSIRVGTKKMNANYPPGLPALVFMKKLLLSCCIVTFRG